MNGTCEHLLPPMRNIAVRPSYSEWPLYNLDTGNTLHPYDIGLSEDIFDAIHYWNESFQAAWKEGGFKTMDEQEAFEDRGHQIIAMIRADRPNILVKNEVILDVWPNAPKDRNSDFTQGTKSPSP